MIGGGLVLFLRICENTGHSDEAVWIQTLEPPSQMHYWFYQIVCFWVNISDDSLRAPWILNGCQTDVIYENFIRKMIVSIFSHLNFAFYVIGNIFSWYENNVFPKRVKIGEAKGQCCKSLVAVPYWLLD